ncbi:methyl-accepting chemotaxis protein [Agaribacter flavus]|uniref:Methyl-accepting chemotaxis protein n=1 Tax=Agaribacter flavus TaxID=1902781 RepID=A0ABV7FXC7_9ALTE
MNLRKKLSIASFAVVTITLFVSQIIVAAINHFKLQEEMTQAANNTSTRLGVTLTDSMWNYNVASSKQIVSVELGTNDLIGVKGFNREGELLFEIYWDEKTNQAVDSPTNTEVFLTLNRAIEYLDQGDAIKAGSIELYFSHSALDEALLELVFTGVLQLLLLGSVLVVFLNFFVVKLVLKPLDEINLRLKDIADGNGDLTKRLTIDREDELGKLADYINRFIDDIHAVITEVVVVARTLDGSAMASQFNADQLNQQVNALNTKVDSILETVDTLEATALDVAEQAAASSTTTTNTSSLASSGLQKVHGVVEMIKQLAGNMQDSTTKTEMLEKHSQSIDTVIQVIKDIAEQTNLLALNAAIEAARAGEQGRGFAVVADEVRTLAQRTQVSTGQITDIITTLQQQSKETLNIMQTGQEMAFENVESVNDTERTFEEIQSSIVGNLEGAKIIARETDEQKNNLQQIKANIEVIKDTNEQTLDVAKQSSDVNKEIVSMSRRVFELVERFKVEESSKDCTF